jgi:hypothetical protein
MRRVVRQAGSSRLASQTTDVANLRSLSEIEAFLPLPLQVANNDGDASAHQSLANAKLGGRFCVSKIVVTFGRAKTQIVRSTARAVLPARPKRNGVPLTVPIPSSSSINVDDISY